MSACYPKKTLRATVLGRFKTLSLCLLLLAKLSFDGEEQNIKRCTSAQTFRTLIVLAGCRARASPTRNGRGTNRPPQLGQVS